MEELILQLPQSILKKIWHQLLPKEMIAEQVAFVFAKHAVEDGINRFDFLEWFPVLPEGFASRSCYHLDLLDEVRVRVIMRAHALGCSIVELHSHCGDMPARFSATDLIGFEEFVPHVWWRLEGRPYAAVVVANDSFDALAWLEDPTTPQRLTAIVTDDGTHLSPTHLSPLGRARGYE